MGTAAAPATPAPAAGRREQRRPRVSSGAALIAGVGTLLLALGVGVLIGRTSNNNATPAAVRNAPVQVITVAGSGSGSGGGSSGNTSTSASTAKAASKQAAASKPKTVVVTKQVAAKASAAASKVLGGKVNTPPTVTVGQSGHGAGYTNGHFTGNFFGP
jgi:hypothetical protein